MANPFFVQSPNYSQGFNQLAQGVQQFGQQRQEEQRRQEAEAYKQRAKQAMAQAFQSGDPMAIRQAVIEYPEIAETATQMFGFTNEQTEQVARETYRRALSETDPERRAAILEGGIETVAQFGGNPRMMAADLRMLRENPEAFDRSARAGYAALASDQEFEAMFPEASGPNIGTYNPRDYTTQSFAEFQRTGDPSVLERYESSRIIDVGGVPHMFNPADRTITPGRITQGGFEATGQPQPFRTGGEEITASSVAETEAEIAGKRTEAQETARQKAKQESPEAQEQRRLKEQEADRTIGLIDRLLKSEDLGSISGASTTVPVVGAAQAFTARDELNDLKALSNLLTMGNLGRMSGVLSESDIRLIANAASGIEVGEYGTPVSESRLREILREIRQRMTNRQNGNAQEGGMGEQDADAFINSVLGQ